MGVVVLLLSLLVAPGSITTVLPSGADLDIGPTLELVSESPLEAFPEETRVYRFFWLPPFESQRTICVRVQEAAGGPELEAKAVRAGKTYAHVKRKLTEQEWEALASAREAGFWKYQPEMFPQLIADGSYWVIERQAGGERLRLVQHEPKAGAFRSLGYLMFRLSGIKLGSREASLREQ